ncbi:transcription factor IIIB 50 kDa subunit isoform X3 [Conger conger]|uniref:transcription factor IIIB 50 kDa subunit isoform X2 n=1 Tax=Conger conger TaxID=82655 RepID=UPI002A5A8823|nr:transcription factor IIIB 50 kDa subunit isoform X2 [Conger conger]XP_061119299.1 transcription factor IIIB 50 kDa subunit isoform X3 [Conger conger]
MESGRSCPDCGSSNLVDDSLYSQSQLVCADCGSVVSEGLLTTTRSEEIQGTDVRYRESTALHKQPCYNQIQGLKRVRALCRILRFPRVIEETAESLFGQAYEHPSFLNVSLQKKEVLAGSCVLLSSRQHHWPIAMGTIYSLLEASEHTMGMVYNELVKILNVDAPPNHIKDLLESHCHQYKLSPSEVPEVFSESTARLVERAAELLELAATTWLVTGRHPVHVLAGVVYVAWLSLNPCKARLAVPLARFFKVAKVALPGQAALRVVELKEVLCRLGRELPWLRGTPVEPRTVPTLTADILKHRVLLMKKAMRSFDHELQASPEGPPAQPLACPEGPPAQPLACPDPVAGGHVQEEGEEVTLRSVTQMQASDWPSTEASRSSTECPQGQPSPSREASPTERTATSDPVPENNWAKRHLFVPPCTRNPPKKRRVEQVGPEVTGYEEISDSEIEGYLRTPQEMDEFAEQQRRLMSADH